MHTTKLWLLLAAGGCSSASSPMGARLPWSDDDPTGHDLTDPHLAITWDDREIVAGVGPAHLARTPTAQGLLLPDRIVATAAGALTPTWSVTLRTVAWGRESHLLPVEPGEVEVDGPWFESRRAGLTEWARATPEGIEHGYTVDQPPRGRGALAVELEVDGTGGPVQVWNQPYSDGIRVAVGDALRLSWAGLRVWDAVQRPLDAWIEVDGTRVRVVVDDHDAVYPVVIDPLITDQSSIVALATGVATSGLGWSIDSDGDRLIIGDPGRNTMVGNGVVAVAYPFGPSLNAPWEEWDELNDSSTAPGLGVSVALEANIAAAALANGTIATFWRAANNTWVNDANFNVDARCATLPQPCLVVDLVDERLIVGDLADSGGEVRVYTHYATSGWSRVATLPGSGSARFGSAVDGDDGLLAVGAPGADVAYVYAFDPDPQANYSLAATHINPDGAGDDFGAAVSLSGHWMAVGSPGASSVFLYKDPSVSPPDAVVRLDAPSWASERFGASLALHQNTLVVTDLPVDPTVAPKLYVYVHTDLAAWSLREVFDLTPGAPAPLPVTISDGMVAVGERHVGSFRTWRRSGSQYVLIDTVVGPAGRDFGESLSLDDGLLVVGAPDLTTSLEGLTRAYLREGDGSFPQQENLFGGLGDAVDVDGEVVVRISSEVGFVSKLGEPAFGLIPADAGLPQGLDFGADVAVDSYGLVVGVPGAGVLGQGGAAVFVPTGGNTWAHLTNIFTGAPGDGFGRQVEINGGDIYIGSATASAGGNLRGEVKLYRLDASLTPYLVRTWSGSVDLERFGSSIAVEGDRLVVGRRGAAGGNGGVSIFRGYRSAPEWEWVSQVAGAAYGGRVAIAGDALYVGSCPLGHVLRFTRALNESGYATSGSVLPGGCESAAMSDLVAVGDPSSDLVELWERRGFGPPVARPDEVSTPEGAGTVFLDVLENDLDPNGDPITLVSVETLDGQVPEYVSVSGSRLRFVPPHADFDVSQFVVYTIEAGGDLVSANASFLVEAENDCPVAGDDHVDEVGFPLTVSFEQVLTIDIEDLLANDTDVDTGDQLSLTTFTQPVPAGVVTRDGDQLRFDPAGAIGDVTFTYTIVDLGGCTATATVTLRVTNERPVKIGDPYYEMLEDQQLVVGPPGLLSRSFVTDREGDPLTATLLVGPERGSLLLAANGGFVYTPEPEDAGILTFTYTVADPYNLPLPLTVTMAYEAVNDPPVAFPDGPFYTPEDRPLLIHRDQLLINDYDVDSPVLEILLDANHPPSSGTAVIDANGNLLYTPPLNFAGDVIVEYLASDFQSTSDLTPITIVVEPQNDPPVATSWDYGTITGPVSGDLAPLVSDPDVGDALVILLVTEPGNGGVTLNGDGTFVYTPKPGFTGTDRFWYAARDLAGASSAPAKVEFVVFQDPLGEDGTTTVVADCTEPKVWYLDADGDGYGTEEFTVLACEEPERYVDRAGDCDDTRPNRHPGAAEIPDDGIDQNCDGADNTARPIGACSTTGSPAGRGALALVALLGLVRRRTAPCSC